MNDNQARTFSYPLMGWPFPAVLVVAPALGAIAATIAFVRDQAPEWFIVIGVALLCGVAAYFYYPVALRIGESSIGVRYLFGPTVWYERAAISHRVAPTGNVLKFRLNDGRVRTRVIGAFLLALPLMRGKHELIQVLQEH